MLSVAMNYLIGRRTSHQIRRTPRYSPPVQVRAANSLLEAPINPVASRPYDDR
jgi:hypothetical protein